MKIKQNSVDISKYITSVTWSGSSEQVSRELSFNIANNPTDSAFKSPTPMLGDIISFYEGKRLFVGIVTGRSKSTELGDVTVDSKDFMHYLIRDKYTGTFKNTTAEKVTDKICRYFDIKKKNIAQTKIHIKKLFAESEGAYNVIVKAYNKASIKNGKYYMPIMEGTKLSVIEKWQPSGVVLEVGNIENAEYNENSDEMVNQVAIYSEKGKKIGIIKNNQSINKYGLYQETYTKEKGVNAKKAAEKLYKRTTKEATITALGDIRAIAGRSIKIKNKATGLSGTYYITSDSHTFENGIHKMQLNIEFRKTRESI